MLDNPELDYTTQLNTYKTNKEKLNTDSINHLSIKDETDKISRADLENEIKANIDYDIIVANK